MKRIAKFSRGLLVLTFFFSILSIGVAVAVETPASLTGATVVDAPKAKALMDSGAVMVDARVANEYAEAHIKGAKSVPYKEKSAKDVKYKALIRPDDQPALTLNKKIMDQYRPQMKQFYYDAAKYDTYLEQLGIKYPTVR